MFQPHLKRLVDSTDGGLAGLLMGFDGIAVDTYAKPDATGLADITTVGMEFSFILTQVRKAADILEIGKVNEVTIRCEKLTLLMRVLSADYFIALAIVGDGNFGKGRFLLRVVAPKLQAELG
jgi:predicted regulator of Ras-like GTPase activity (Roadblock/LC7/MglB family)